jgi:hypothetical protein
VSGINILTKTASFSILSQKGEEYIMTKKGKRLSTLFIVFIALILCISTVNSTFAATLPTVITKQPTITLTVITLNGEITANGGSTIVDHGFYWGTSQATMNNRISLGSRSGTGLGNFSRALTSIAAPNTVLYYRAYATNSYGIAYGVTISFIIREPAILPTSVTISPKTLTLDIGKMQQLTATVLPVNATDKTVNWRSSNMAIATVSTTGLVTARAAGTAIITVTTNTAGKTDTCIVTIRVIPPNVRTDPPTNVTTTEATLNGYISNSGYVIYSDVASVMECGFILWGPDSIKRQIIIRPIYPTGAFSYRATGLTPATRYSYQAFARSSAGYVYGNIVIFTTQSVPISIPKVTTKPQTISLTAATINGEITQNTAPSITDHGFYLGTSQTNLIAPGNKRSLGSKGGNGLGTFLMQLTSLTPNTIYYYQAYATNAAGTGYGTVLYFRVMAPIINTSSLPIAYVDRVYSYTLTADGTIPMAWSIISGSLPPGLSLNSTTGLISGIPTATGAGKTYTFTVKVSNVAGYATKPLYINVVNIVTPPKITTISLPEYYIGRTYNQTLTATGTQPITWSIYSGSLPPGFSLNQSTGVISGSSTTASAGRTFSFTVRAMNSAGSETKALNIYVSGLATIPPKGFVGQLYSCKLNVSFTTVALPITWSIDFGTLPAGLRLNPFPGEILGTPTKAGTYNFTVTGRNSIGVVLTTPLSIVVN